MSFEEMFKSDFIRHLQDHDNKSSAEAEDIWNMYGEEYIENMYQFMSDSIWHYRNEFAEDNSEDNSYKEIA